MRLNYAIKAFAVTGCMLLAVGAVHANPMNLGATHDATAPNFFTVDFHDGSPRAANISTTDYVLQVDDQAGTAKFINYNQVIDPLEIFPGVSTGTIHVSIVSSELGTFDRTTGDFTTTDTYEITFDDSQLAAYGITSPVRLPSTSQGTITFGAGQQAKRISMHWDGSGLIAGLPFDYTCHISTRFKVRPLEATPAAAVQQYVPRVNAPRDNAAPDKAAFAEPIRRHAASRRRS